MSSLMGQMMSGYTVVAGSSVDEGKESAPTTTTTTTTKKAAKKQPAKKKQAAKKVSKTAPVQTKTVVETHAGDQIVTTTEGGTTKIMTTQVHEGGHMTHTVQRGDRESGQYLGHVGSDYSHIDQGHYAPKGPVNKYGIAVGTPINRILVEKLQAPKVASCMRELFESGDLPDLKKVPDKIQIIRDDAPQAGVYENEPSRRDDVVRESDEVTTGELLTEGTTKNIVTAWADITSSRGTDAKMSTIKIDTSLSGPDSAENEPVKREGVIREGDPMEDFRSPEDGHTDKLRFKFLYPEETKLERGPIKLVEKEGEQVVYENEPTAPRANVVRSDFGEEQMSCEPGYIRNVTGFFATVSDDLRKQKAPIVIDRSNVSVLENDPTQREDVVRESDVQDVDANLAINQGSTRNLAGRWQNMQDTGPQKGPFQMDLAPEAGVLENEPVILENVIRCDAPTEDVMLPGAPGRIKSIAGRFVSPSRTEGVRKEPIQIDLAPEAGVLENTPAERNPDIVRCDEFTADQCEIRVEEGCAKNLHSQWRQHEEEHMKVKTALDFQGGEVPTWIKEMQSQGNGGVYENEPDFREGVIREQDVNPDEAGQEELIPSNMSKAMKSMWLNREGEIARIQEEKRRYQPEVHKGGGELKRAIREAEKEMQEKLSKNETPRERFDRERKVKKEREDREKIEREAAELKKKEEDEKKAKEERRANIRNKKKGTPAASSLKTTPKTTPNLKSAAGNKPKVSLFR